MFRFIAILIATLPLAACGGGLGGLFANPTTVQLQSNATESGFIWEGGDVFKSTSSMFLVGDSAANGTAYAYVRFSLATIPAGARITDARLVMGQETVWGVPYSNIGPTLRVDHIDLGASLNYADMSAPNLLALDMSVLAFDPVTEAKEANVEPAVDYAIDNGMPSVDFRFRFDQSTNGDNSFDLIWLNNESDTGGSGIRPTLIVTYEE